MKKIVFMLLCTLLFIPGVVFAVEKAGDLQNKKPISAPSQQYSIELTVKGIPKEQQTLFIPIAIDTMVLDFESVGLEGLSTQNILAVTSNSMDMVGPGVGLLKLDDNGLPEALNLKVTLKPIGQGQSSISLLKITDEPALLSKGTIINNEVKVTATPFNEASEIEVVEKLENGKKKLVSSQKKLTLNIQRQSQKEESIFIPIIFNKNVIDLDETFGHNVLAPGISAKSFSCASLHEGGPGIEVVLTDQAEKDFSVDLDIYPRRPGKTKIAHALAQIGHTAVISGPTVDINPKVITVGSNPIVLGN